MSEVTIPRPAAGEYAPYYGKYIQAVPDGDVVDTLSDQLVEMVALIHQIGEKGAMHRYAPDKWSIKETIGHIADAERIFAYRLLRFARGDQTPLPGFEQNDYVPNGNFDSRSLEDLEEELACVRASTIALLNGLDEKALARSGTASGVQMSVRSLAWTIAGHERHHMNILREKYLPTLP